MKLGIVTYQIAQSWDCATIIEKCVEVGLSGVELRTTHAHGVEVSLSPQERLDVKNRFADSPVKLLGLGSAFDYHTPDKQELARTLEETRKYIMLAHDVGAEGVKVRPNNLPETVPVEQTIEQIGCSLREVANFANDYGIKIRLEVHGPKSSHPPVIRQILDVADHRNLYVCWNSNKTDIDESGSIDKHFDMLKDSIEICHINELWNDYPWIRLFQLLKQNNFSGYCLAEIPDSSDPVTVLKYYRKLFDTFLMV